jgi:hypothetical protein
VGVGVCCIFFGGGGKRGGGRGDKPPALRCPRRHTHTRARDARPRALQRRQDLERIVPRPDTVSVGYDPDACEGVVAQTLAWLSWMKEGLLRPARRCARSCVSLGPRGVAVAPHAAPWWRDAARAWQVCCHAKPERVTLRPPPPLLACVTTTHTSTPHTSHVTGVRPSVRCCAGRSCWLRPGCVRVSETHVVAPKACARGTCPAGLTLPCTMRHTHACVHTRIQQPRRCTTTHDTCHHTMSHMLQIATCAPSRASLKGGASQPWRSRCARACVRA